MLQLEPDNRFQSYTIVTQWVVRVCLTSLTPNQFAVAMFIVDRTYGWGKTHEVITYRQFLKGIPAKSPDNAPFAPALPMARPTLSAALDSLISMGLVLTAKGRTLIAYEINLDWKPTPDTIDHMSLRSPKRLQDLHSLQTTKPSLVRKTSSGDEPIVVQEMNRSSVQEVNIKKSNGLKKSNRKKTDTSYPLPSAELPEKPSLDEVIADTLNHSRSRRSVKVLRWIQSSAPIAWQEALSRHWPEEPHMTTINTQGYALHRYGKKWIAAGPDRTVTSWLEYLNWTVSHWSIVRAEHFGWMHDGSPAIPSISFFVKFASRFEQAYEQKQSLETISRMSPRDREVARMVRSGTEQESAEKAADERMGLSRDRERLEQAAATIRRQNLTQQNIRVDQDLAAERRAVWKDRRREAAPSAVGEFDEWR